jgi:AcrR family transcriptional regulator
MRRATRGAIIAASLELFAKRGYSATTTEEIARKARISKGLIFTHFRTKQDILFAILDEQIEEIMPRFFSDDDPRPARERFIALVDSWLDVIKTRPLLVRLSLQLGLDEEYRKLMKRKGKQYFEATFLRLTKLIRQLGSDKPEMDCYLLMFVFDGIVANYTVAPELFPIESIRDHLIATLFARWDARPQRGTARKTGRLLRPPSAASQ